MNLVIVGFNYKNTPLAFREMLAFDGKQSVKLGKNLLNHDVVKESFIVSTCNRTEIYCIGSCVEGVKETVYHILSEMTGLGAEELKKVSYNFHEAGALKHLFRVASSLDAMVVGEAQILGQLKSAYQLAVEYETVGPYLHKACHSAFRVAKRVRTETDIALFPVSVGTLAVELIENEFNDLSRLNILVIGAGEMGSLVADRLREKSSSHIWVANRTESSAKILAEVVGGIVVPFDSWQYHLQTADVVVTSVSGGGLIKKEHIERHGRLIIIDLAVPRNVDELCGTISGIKLYNIDDLQDLAGKNLSARKDAAVIAENLVKEESEIVFDELRQIKLAPILNNLRKKCVKVMDAELGKFYARNPSLSSREKESAKLCAETIIKKIMHDPIRLAKEELARPGANGIEITQTLQKLFGVSL